MQGIEILNKEPVMIQDDRLMIVGLMCIGITLILAGIMSKIENELLQNILFHIVVVCIFVGFILVTSYKDIKISSDRYQYEAIIDENVSIQEVYEKYNVIEQDGKKWILEDKECAE